MSLKSSCTPNTKTLLAGVAAITVGLAGCEGPAIYRNHVLDAVSESRTVAITPMSAKNSAFRLFRVGNEGVALLPVATSSTTVDQLNTALIFAPKDFEELRGACLRMVESLKDKPAAGIEFIQYRLLSATEEAVARGNAEVTTYGASSEYETRTGHRILFELQLMKDAGSYWGPDATYSFRGVRGTLSVDNLRRLSEDLQQK